MPDEEKTPSTSKKLSTALSKYSLLNIQGLVPQTKPSKVPYVGGFLNEKNQLFVALTETWLNDDYLEAELDIDGYQIYRSDRQRVRTKHGRLSGGVCLYLRNDFASTFKSVVEFSNGVVELLAIYSNHLDLCLIVLYRQPDQYSGHRSTNIHFSDAMKEVQNFLSSIDHCPNIILTGDFNLPNVKWLKSETASLSSVYGEEKRIFLTLDEFCVNYGLCQKITAATHMAGNTLDLVFTNNDALFHSSSCYTVLRSISHHNTVEINLTSEVFNSNRTIRQTPPERDGLYKFNFFDENINWDDVNNAFSNVDWENDLKDLDVDAMVKHFIDVVEKVCNDLVPLKPPTASKNKSKIPRNRKLLMRRRRKLNIKLQQPNLSSTKRNSLTNALINIEKTILESLQHSHMYQESKAIDAIKKNSKYFYSYVNKLSKVKTKVGPLLTEHNDFTSDNKEMADILSQQFSSVFSPQQSALQPPNTMFPLEDLAQNASMNNIIFTLEDIIKAIHKLTSTSAAGPDGFSALLLKKCSSSLASALFILFRKSLDCGVVPKSFKLSNIVPIFKSGSKGIAVNYRPVALTSHLSKIFERVVSAKLIVFFEDQKVFNEKQHGFRKGRSCISQLLEHYENILNLLDNGYNVDVVYLDFCKAFDKLDFNIILQKLKRCGVGGLLGRWLYSFLTNRHQYVSVNGFRSNLCQILSGVPQGSVLGPLLFILMIGDIDGNILQSFLSSFADDTRIGIGIKSAQDVKTLQEDLDKIYRWTVENNMVLNPSKFELLQYGKQTIDGSPYKYKSSTGDDIVSKDVVKDLGVLMSSNCHFTPHIDSVVSKVKKMTSWALRNFKSRSKDFILTTWKSIVLPIVDYASQLWNPSKVHDINRLEMLQKYFLKKIQFYQDWSYWDMLEDLGIYSLQRRRERYRIIYMWSILEGIVPNPCPQNIFAKFNARLGRSCAVPAAKNSPYRGLVSSSFSVHGAKLFNVLPKVLRNMTSCGKEAFKKSLDQFLKTVRDEPQICGYTSFRSGASNSLLDMV